MELKASTGHLHPLSVILREALNIFILLGFDVAEGPEVESEYHNFDALNIPQYHPARDMWDTFWLKGEGPRAEWRREPHDLNNDKQKKTARVLLRTHTSPVQIRFMETHKPPLRVVSAGKVFRYEATDATHEAQFYQLEALVIDKDISLGHLKWIVEKFLNGLFGENVLSRFRPTYFPFVEPGVEVDLSCLGCGSKVKSNCPLCKGSGWLEIIGAGMVHPKVLESAGVDPRGWQGFALGCGIDRLLMLRHGIPDIRLLYAGDLRLVHQF